MLRSQREVRLFGQRYEAIFAGLAIAAAILIIFLIPNFPRTQAHVSAAAALQVPALREVRTDWIRLLIIFALLGITTTAAAVTVYSYFATRQKLAKVQTTAKAILESLVGGVLTLDTGGSVTIINRAACQILEIGSEPPHPNLAELAEQHRALAGLIHKALDVRHYVQDEDSIFVNSRNEPLVLRTSISEQVDETGERVGIVVLVKDVSKLVAMESELRKRDRLATAGTLAAGVAHEIRNPLSALELNLRLLRDEVNGICTTDGDIEGYFEILFAETRRLNRITSNFLQLSRPEPLARVPVAVHQAMKQVARLVNREAQEKNISLVLDLAGGDPQVLGDATKIEQVCLNILINAMQSMSTGGVIDIASTIGWSGGRRFVNLSFADQGVGIAPENLSRLFDPYFTTRSDGTGLGLANADRIVTDHGGTITVESTVGVGTVMTVCLPLADGSAQEPAV
jgi:two-component system sensor histidine kinase HydH